MATAPARAPRPGVPGSGPRSRLPNPNDDGRPGSADGRRQQQPASRVGGQRACAAARCGLPLAAGRGRLCFICFFLVIVVVEC